MPGLSQSPNGLGAVTGLAVAPALSLAFVGKRFYRAFWITMLLICLTGLALSASRIGALTALGTLALWVIYHYRLDKGFAIVLSLMTLVGGALAVYSYAEFGGGQSVANRLSAATEPYDDGPASERLYQYSTTLQEAWQRPIIGTGLAKEDMDIAGLDVHNMFLLFLRAGGLLSILGILIIVVDLLKKGSNLFSHAKRRDSKSIAVALFASVVGLVIISLTEPLSFHRMIWAPVALVFPFYASVSHRGSQQILQRGRFKKSRGIYTAEPMK